MRGLLKHSTEVNLGLLPRVEAFKLLLAAAEMDEGDVAEGSDEYHVAMEVVELCGRLPLTLAIAGGLVLDNGQAFTADISELLKDNPDHMEDDEGQTVEERIISSSVTQMIPWSPLAITARTSASHPSP